MIKEEILRDKDIREPLFEFLEETFGRIRIIEEKRVGKSRADLMMIVPSEIVGLEIKSDADSYARLARQVKDYDNYFDRNYVVVGTSHAMHIEEHVPAWWGIITVEMVDGKADFYILRTAKMNPKQDKKKKLTLLWRPELAHIQQLNQMAAYKQKSKGFVIEKILEKVKADTLDEQISQELYERDYEAIEAIIREYRIQSGKKPRRRRRKYK